MHWHTGYKLPVLFFKPKQYPFVYQGSQHPPVEIPEETKKFVDENTKMTFTNDFIGSNPCRLSIEQFDRRYGFIVLLGIDTIENYLSLRAFHCSKS